MFWVYFIPSMSLCIIFVFSSIFLNIWAPVPVSSGYCNKIPLARQLEQQPLISSRSGDTSPISKCLWIQDNACPLPRLLKAVLSLHPSLIHAFSSVSKKATNPIMRDPRSWSSNTKSSKVPSPNISALKVRISTYKLGVRWADRVYGGDNSLHSCLCLVTTSCDLAYV